MFNEYIGQGIKDLILSLVIRSDKRITCGKKIPLPKLESFVSHGRAARTESRVSYCESFSVLFVDL